MTGPYSRAADYWRAGWICPIPVVGKNSPPAGFTGAAGRTVSWPDLQAWLDGPEAGRNIAIRLVSTVGIDVDAHDGKKGEPTLAAAEDKLGPLPPTWSSTSRGPGQPSRIRFFRIPHDADLSGAEGRVRQAFGEHVDILHRGHRYAMVASSIHPDTGGVYRWYGPDGAESEQIPAMLTLPELPEPWLEFLTTPTRVEQPPATIQPTQEHVGPIPGGQRHDTLMRYACHLLEVAPRLTQLEYEVLCWRRWRDCQQPPAATYLWTWEEALNNPVREVRTRYADTTVDEELAAQIEAGQRHTRRVAEETDRLRARREAEATLRADTRPPMPALERLDQLLARPLDPVRYRIDRLWPRFGRVVASAQAKAGKTTLRDNLVRALADGGQFLGRYHVEMLVGDVVVGVLDFEMADDTVQRWLTEQNIQNTEYVWVGCLRGKATTFDLLDERRRAEWAEQLRSHGVKVLIFDCLGPVLAALGLDENSAVDVGRFLVAFDALMEEAGVDEALIVHHMGHDAERSRGASRLRDWPDAEWRLLRTTDKDGKPEPTRYFAAVGRDVDEPEAALAYDTATRHLTLAGGNRAEAKVDHDVTAVVEYVRGDPGATKTTIEAELSSSINAHRCRAAMSLAVRRGTLHMHIGARNAHNHYVAQDCEMCNAATLL